MLSGCDGSSRLRLPTPLAGGVGKRWTILENDISDAEHGITLHLSCLPEAFGAGQDPDDTTTPTWIVTVGTSPGSSVFRLDAVPGATLLLPAKTITLEAVIEQGNVWNENPGTLPAASLGGKSFIYNYHASSGMGGRGGPMGQQAGYTFIRGPVLAPGGGNTGAVKLPPATRAVEIQGNDPTNLLTASLSCHNEFIPTQVVVSTQRTIIVPGNAGYIQLTNTTLVPIRAQATAILGL